MSQSNSTNTEGSASTDVEDPAFDRHLQPPISTSASPVEPQVKATKKQKTRRSFSEAYKERILAAFDACVSSQERGAFLRKEGLYHSRIIAWRQAKAKQLSSDKRLKKRSDHLAEENSQLKKKLAQAEAIIELQKKVSDLLGSHILPTKHIGQT